MFVLSFYYGLCLKSTQEHDQISRIYGKYQNFGKDVTFNNYKI